MQTPNTEPAYMPTTDKYKTRLGKIKCRVAKSMCLCKYVKRHRQTALQAVAAHRVRIAAKQGAARASIGGQTDYSAARVSRILVLTS